MKKILCFILLFFLLSTAVCSAQVTNVWFKIQGLKVYIPQKDMLTSPMTHAFQEWQKKSNNKISFIFVNTKSTADIEVIFLNSGVADICGPNALGCTANMYKTTHLGTRIISGKIYISRKSFKNRVMSNTEVYTIMLHEIGHSLGLGHSNNIKSLMYPSTNQSMAVKQEILDEDIQNLYKIYEIKN